MKFIKKKNQSAGKTTINSAFVGYIFILTHGKMCPTRGIQLLLRVYNSMFVSFTD